MLRPLLALLASLLAALAVADVIIDFMPGNTVAGLNRSNLIVSGNVTLNGRGVVAIAVAP